MTSYPKKENELGGHNQTMIGAGVAIGVGVGVAIGTAMGNIGAGIAIGISIGVAIGAGLQKENKSDKRKINSSEIAT